MIETRRFKNLVIFIQTNRMLQKTIASEKSEKNIKFFLEVEW